MVDDSIEARLAQTGRNQGEASNPELSVWVSANAGTGKTHVLTMRVLRLLLAGTRPEAILCLTYTKAAAAEMSKRVFDELAKWVTVPDNKLADSLEKLTGKSPTAAELARARTLFTSAIETPGGLKIQTIHAFAEQVLQRFPLEAGVAPGFSILDEEEARSLRREAIDATLAIASQPGSGELGAALTVAIAYAADERFDDLLAAALGEREWLEAADRMGFDAAEALLRRHFNVRPRATRHAIETEMARFAHDQTTRAAYSYLIPMTRRGTLDEIADPAVFLCSGDSRYVHGHTLNVDGGFLSAGLMFGPCKSAPQP